MIGMSDHDNHAEESDQSIDGWQTNICHPPSLPAEPLVSTHMQDVFFSLKNLIFHLHIQLTKSSLAIHGGAIFSAVCG